MPNIPPLRLLKVAFLEDMIVENHLISIKISFLLPLDKTMPFYSVYSHSIRTYEEKLSRICIQATGLENEYKEYGLSKSERVKGTLNNQVIKAYRLLSVRRTPFAQIRPLFANG